MQAVVLAAAESPRLRRLTADKPKAMVEVCEKPILTHCFEQLQALGATELFVVVGYKMETIMSHYDKDFDGIPITYAHQQKQLGLAHALLTVTKFIDDTFMLMLGDNIFRANLDDVIECQRKDCTDAAFLVEEVPSAEATRRGVCVTNEDGEITGIVEKPNNPPTNLVTTGFYVFRPAIFHACHLIQHSERGEYELSDAIDLLIHSDRSVNVVRMDGWRVDINYPENRDEAERRLEEEVPR